MSWGLWLLGAETGAGEVGLNRVMGEREQIGSDGTSEAYLGEKGRCSRGMKVIVDEERVEDRLQRLSARARRPRPPQHHG